jgi:hypothetical protein
MKNIKQQEKYKKKLGWSVSRVERLDYCERQYGYRYYPETLKEFGSKWAFYWEALKIKNLESLELWVGNRVHSEISKILRIIESNKQNEFNKKNFKNNRYPEIIREMHEQFKASERKDYSRYESKNPFGLLKHYDKTATKEDLNESIEYVLECINSFLKFEYLQMIIVKIEASKHFIEKKDWELKKFKCNEFPNIELWALPDFWIEYKPGRFIIFDWKTGKESPNKKPLLAYAFRLYKEILEPLLEQGKLQTPPIIEGYNVYLPSGNIIGETMVHEDIINFGNEVLTEDIEILSRYLKFQDTERNIPIVIEKFKKTTYSKRCINCPYSKFCERIP